MSPITDPRPCSVCGSWHWSDCVGQLPYCQPSATRLDIRASAFPTGWFDDDDPFYIGKHVQKEEAT